MRTARSQIQQLQISCALAIDDRGVAERIVDALREVVCTTQHNGLYILLRPKCAGRLFLAQATAGAPPHRRSTEPALNYNLKN